MLKEVAYVLNRPFKLHYKVFTLLGNIELLNYLVIPTLACDKTCLLEDYLWLIRHFAFMITPKGRLPLVWMIYD